MTWPDLRRLVARANEAPRPCRHHRRCIGALGPIDTGTTPEKNAERVRYLSGVGRLCPHHARLAIAEDWREFEADPSNARNALRKARGET